MFRATNSKQCLVKGLGFDSAGEFTDRPRSKRGAVPTESQESRTETPHMHLENLPLAHVGARICCQ
eukprot:1969895-Rhodomonas_salina.1